MNKSTFRNVGIAALILSIILIFINDIVDSEFLNTLSNYKTSIGIFGGIIIGYSFYDKKNGTEVGNQEQKSNLYPKYMLGIFLGLIAYHLINYFYTIYFK